MDFLKLAIHNISSYGDTDIFPFPMENALFFDRSNDVENLLMSVEGDFDSWVSKYPVEFIKTCVPVGYTGYRWATMIDPLWNCFLLFQVLKNSEKLEESRVSASKNNVFSYRIRLDEATGKLFDPDYNWRRYYTTAIEYAESDQYGFIVRFDISDFYNRVYHHRLENALLRSGVDGNDKKRIMGILKVMSNNFSYGLPVGGNAARILAEIVLNSLDQMMMHKSYLFCRYVDDYILFAETREDAFRKLNYCADFLLRNEGLSLQKSKTQILTASEFVSQAKATTEGDDGEDKKERADFLKLHIRYDPYSATADEDYSELKEKISQFNILSLLKSELRKSRIHQALGKQILNAITFLDGEKLNLAFDVICSNIEQLYPVFPSVMQIAHKKIRDISKVTQKDFVTMLYGLVEEDSYILQTENNASYAVRVLAQINDELSWQAIDRLYSRMQSSLVKYNSVYAMANLNNHYWLSDLKSKLS